MSRGWAKASACRLQITLSCAVLCNVVSLQYLSRSSIHRLAGLPCRLFLSLGLQVVTREVHRLSFRRLICPAQDHFVFLIVYIIYITFAIATTIVFAMFILRPIRLLSSDSSCSIFCSSCGVSVHMNITSKAEIGEKFSVYLHALILPV